MEAAQPFGAGVRVGDVEIHPDGLVLAAGQPLCVTPREHQLLSILAENVGRIVSREALYRASWGGELRAGDRSVDVYVHRLRTKLAEALPDRAYIHTHHRFGYRLAPARSQPFHSRDTDR